MIREKALRILLVVFGLTFVAGVYHLITSVRSSWQGNREDAEPMGISLYVTMGIFLLMAARNPSANRGVIVFVAWLNIAHAAVMAVIAGSPPHQSRGLVISATLVCGFRGALRFIASAN